MTNAVPGLYTSTVAQLFQANPDWALELAVAQCRKYGSGFVQGASELEETLIYSLDNLDPSDTRSFKTAVIDGLDNLMVNYTSLYPSREFIRKAYDDYESFEDMADDGIFVYDLKTIFTGGTWKSDWMRFIVVVEH